MASKTFPSDTEAWMTVTPVGINGEGISLPSGALSKPLPPGIWILTLHNNDNRFSIPFINAIHAALDYLCAQKPFTGLITINKGKIFSNGLVFENLIQLGVPYFRAYQELLERVLTLQVPTIACMSGHAFAGGCMFALAHDYRTMLSTRGFMCMNEIDLPAGLTPGMTSILRAKIVHPIAFRNCILQGHRFSGSEALSYGMVDFTVENEQDFLPKAVVFLAPWAKKSLKAGMIYKLLKREMYVETRKMLLECELGQVWLQLEAGEKAGMKIGALKTRPPATKNDPYCKL